MAPVDAPLGAFGRMAERSRGQGFGHRSLGDGRHRPRSRRFRRFRTAFRADVIAEFERAHRPRARSATRRRRARRSSTSSGRSTCGPGLPIVYTSADSVFQIAAHEEIIPVPELYRICEIAYELVGRGHGRRPRDRAAVRRHAGRVQADRQPARLRAAAGGHDAARRADVGAARPCSRSARSRICSPAAASRRPCTRAATIRAWTRSKRPSPRSGAGLIFTNLVDFDTSTATATIRRLRGEPRAIRRAAREAAAARCVRATCS